MKKISWPAWPSRKQIITFLKDVAEKGVVLLVIVYIAVTVGRSVSKNYQINKQIKGLEQELAALQQEELYLKNLIAYYKTDTFRELRQREELGYKLPGEHVLSVPVEPEDRPEGAKVDLLVNKEEALPLPNYAKWFNYFFSS